MHLKWIKNVLLIPQIGHINCTIRDTIGTGLELSGTLVFESTRVSQAPKFKMLNLKQFDGNAPYEHIELRCPTAVWSDFGGQLCKLPHHTLPYQD